MQTRIAIVGVSALFPGSASAGSFWSNILSGKDLMSDVPPSHWLIEDYYDPDPSARDKTYCKRGAFLSPVGFDALEFGIPPSMLSSTDTSQLLALITARQVLDDAAVGQFSKVARDRISVILGVASGTELLGQMVSRLQRPLWQKGLRDSGFSEEQVQAACDSISDQFVPWRESTFPGLLGNVVAGRIANRLDLGGTNCVVDAACASSLAAVSMAVNELYLGQSDLAIVGGVDTINDILMYMCFSKTPALSASGDCRPFSSKADGTMMGEGMAMLALRRLEDAERDGDAIYAVLEAMGSSSDGKSKSVYAPVSAGQAKALRRTYERAGYGPETVELVEAHGTGTIAGDAAEFGALREVFNATGRSDRQWCALGSVKSQIGHTKAAAGAAGLFKAVMALHHRVLPPTIKVEQPNPELDLENSPFYLNTNARPWIANPRFPRRASVSAFGFGGSNFHAALEEYTGPGARPGRLRSCSAELFLFSGASGAAVAEQCRSVVKALRDGIPADYLAEQCRKCFDVSQPARLSLVAADETKMIEQLEKTANRVPKSAGADFDDPAGAFFRQGDAAPKVAFLFPGQGSQYVGMGTHVANEFDAARQAWDRSIGLTDERGNSVASVNFPRPVFSDEERERQELLLTSTEWAQPALGIASLGYLNLIAKLEIEAACMAGHSFGELTALHAAGVIDEPGFLRAAWERGQLMKAAAGNPGAMTAVTASMAQLQEWIGESGSDAVVANANEPRQTVASGSVNSIEALEALLGRKNIGFKRIRVATAFHSPMVAEASATFRSFLGDVEFRPSKIPVYSNTQVIPYSVDRSDCCRDLLAAQISRPVLFVEQIRAMYESGVRVFLEVGPGTTLTNLTQRCLTGLPHEAISLDRKGMHGVTALYQALARLSAAGVRMNYDGLFSEFKEVAAPAKQKPGVTFPISGVNYGKPYPGLGPGAPPAKPKTTPAVAAKPTGLPLKVDTPAITVRSTKSSINSFQGTNMTNDNNGLAHSKEGNSWLQVYLEIQRQTAEAHLFYQRAMMEGHTAYLRSMEMFFSGLSGVNAPALAANSSLLQLQAPAPAAPAFTAPPLQAYPAPASVPLRVTVTVPEAPMAPPVQAMPPVPVPAAKAPVPGANFVSPSAEELKSALLVVVADKTGYPVETLDMNMDMESDLGIDSIKRVEILSAFRSATPNMPEIKAKEMAGLRTLAQIAAFVEASIDSRGLL